MALQRSCIFSYLKKANHSDIFAIWNHITKYYPPSHENNYYTCDYCFITYHNCWNDDNFYCNKCKTIRCGECPDIEQKETCTTCGSITYYYGGCEYCGLISQTTSCHKCSVIDENALECETCGWNHTPHCNVIYDPNSKIARPHQK